MRDNERLDIENELAAHVAFVADGKCADWASYKMQIGWIAALRKVLGITADNEARASKEKNGVGSSDAVTIGVPTL